jgi:UDP-GlcNAc:undecaprenyl-phosphate GlcNAc-1-phosphate transferase
VTLYLLVLLTSAAVTYVATPLARRLAERWGAVTPVRDRDVHSVPVPRLGGLAMLAGVTVSFLVASGTPFFGRIFGESGAPWGILGAAALMCAVGVVDDIWDLDSLTKLAGQVLAAGLMAWQGVQLVTLPLAGVTLGSGGLFLALTVLAVVVTVNAVNFVDGLDGLAAGVIGIGGAAFFVYTYMLTRQTSPSDFSSLAAVVTAALVGCCVGFLPHNLHPARIFMGDSGALLLGLLLAASVVAVTGQVDPTMVSDAQIVPAFFPVLLPLAVLLVPMVDLVLAVVRRLGRGQSPFAADRRHLHHRLLDLGHSHARAVGVMYLWTAVLSFGAVATAFVPLRWWLPVFLGVVALSLVLTLGPMQARRAGRPAGAATGGR